MTQAKMLPRGLYGCETSPVNEEAMQNMRSSIATALTYTTTRRSVDLTFAMASGTVDLDPDIEVYTRRAALCRRVIGDAKSKERWQTRSLR